MYDHETLKNHPRRLLLKRSAVVAASVTSTTIVLTHSSAVSAQPNDEKEALTAQTTEGPFYLEAMASRSDIAEGLSLGVHAGHQKIQNFSKLDYTDYKLSVSKAYQGFNLGLSYTTTNATDNSLYHVKTNGDDKVLSGNILAASVNRSF